MKLATAPGSDTLAQTLVTGGMGQTGGQATDRRCATPAYRLGPSPVDGAPGATQLHGGDAKSGTSYAARRAGL